MLDLWCIDAEQSETFGPAAERVAVHHVGGRTINDH
jgi:hypothetical protein